MNRNREISLGIALLLLYLTGALSSSAGGIQSSAVPNPDLEYLKAINNVGPPADPQLLFLLMTQFISANRQAEGADFFSTRLKEFEPRLTDAQKSLYLSIAGLLRAQHAKAVPLLQRVG